jgi:DNA-directed RNA polymerase alpha subunit
VHHSDTSQTAKQGAPLLSTELPKRALNALMRGGIQTLEEAAEWSDRDLLSLPNFGPVSIAALRRLTGQATDQ